MFGLFGQYGGFLKGDDAQNKEILWHNHPYGAFRFAAFRMTTYGELAAPADPI